MAEAGVCYRTAGVNYELAGACFSVTADEQQLWQSAIGREGWFFFLVFLLHEEDVTLNMDRWTY